MTYYTPPELREEMERFDIVLSNPPFRTDYPTGSGKTRPVRRLIEMLRERVRRIMEKLPAY